MAKFEVGDSVVVLGDLGDTQHEIDSGSEAVVLLVMKHGNSKEQCFVSTQHTPAEARDFDWENVEDWEVWIQCEIEWVAEEDLFPNFFPDFPVPTVTPPVKEAVVEDVVKHPSHYNQGLPEGVQVADIIREQGWFENFALGNVTKYILRAQYKGTYRQDIRKAHQYLSMLIDSWEDDGDG